MPGSEPDAASDAESWDPSDRYAVLRLPNFRRYWTGSLLWILGMQMQSITVAWEVYRRTGSALDVGLVGLVQVIPLLSFILLAGHVADRHNRRYVLMAALSLSCVASLGLAAISYFELPTAGMYVCLFSIGVARAFQQPARSSLLPQLVPRVLFPNAVTWGLGGFQLAQVLGPALAGWMLGMFEHAYLIYMIQAAGAITFIALLSGVKQTTYNEIASSATLKSLGEGVQFVWHNKVILGAMALDMFAVLLGGATALLPIYAKDILQVGPTGLGWMASAPAVGALCMSFALVHRGPMSRAGRTLLVAVAGFGAAIIVFGLSTSLTVSLVALFLTGAFDCISVVVRHTLVQTLTPDRMRGRVSAISGMFISASNELGEFESGTLAYWTSPVFAVVFGGIGTLTVVLTAALTIPELRHYGRLDGEGKEPRAKEAEGERLEAGKGSLQE